mmetsp:Transcript_4155/g.12495  ORF Transcript_4155/g.12495 Transcript_4155/m.12495 type:complete len:278 (+) Transcript_4155:68-901(+)
MTMRRFETGFVGGFWSGGRCRRQRAAAACVAGDARRAVDAPVAAGDTVTIVYRPPEGFFKAQDLHFAGGFNGWNGSEVPMMTPARQEGNGEYRVVVTVPNFARIIDFAFSDGVRYDTNDGKYFHIPVRYQQRLNKEGEPEMFDADSETQLKVELGEFRNSQGETVAAISSDQERLLHESRAKAALVAEKFSLGAIHVSQATAAFDRYDKRSVGLISMSSAVEALTELGFEINADDINGMLREFAGADTSHTFEDLTPSDFIVAYGLLESNDEGLEMI